MNVRISVLAGPLLALVLAACPTLAPIASAQAQGHSCCPSNGSERPREKGQPVLDIAACCPLATLPSSVMAPPVSLALVALLPQVPILVLERESFAWDSTGLSPPRCTDDPAASSSRAPPYLA